MNLLTSEQHTIQSQRERIEELEEEVRQIRETFVPVILMPREWNLTKAEERIVAAFVRAKNGALSKEQLYVAMSTREINRDTELDNLVKVRISTLRKKLQPFGIEIVTRWAIGYEMPASSVAAIRGALHAIAA